MRTFRSYIYVLKNAVLFRILYGKGLSHLFPIYYGKVLSHLFPIYYGRVLSHLFPLYYGKVLSHLLMITRRHVKRLYRVKNVTSQRSEDFKIRSRDITCLLELATV